jgi:hypothetical protein
MEDHRDPHDSETCLLPEQPETAGSKTSYLYTRALRPGGRRTVTGIFEDEQHGLPWSWHGVLDAEPGTDFPFSLAKEPFPEPSAQILHFSIIFFRRPAARSESVKKSIVLRMIFKIPALWSREKGLPGLGVRSLLLKK